jgi:hypothetical protein
MCLLQKKVPNKDPKFHHALKFVEVGNPISALLGIFISGCGARIGLFIIYFVWRRGPFEMLVLFTATVKVRNRYSAMTIVMIPFC